MLCCQVEILHLKDQNLGQILHVDKTCFLRPGHIFTCSTTQKFVASLGTVTKLLYIKAIV